MVEKEVLEAMRTKFPEAEKLEVDYIGACEAAKLSITIIDKQFEGKKKLERHRMANEPIKEMLTSGKIHAAQFKLAAPGEDGK